MRRTDSRSGRTDRLGVAPNVRIQVWDVSSPALHEAARAGRGRLIAEHSGHNRVTFAGRNMLRDLLNGDAGLSGLTDFAFGTGDTPAGYGDTTLENQIFRSAITVTAKSDLTLSAKYFLSSSQLNGETIREAGLFSDEDTLFARYVFTTPIVKTSAIAVTFSWAITFTGESEFMVTEGGSGKALGGDPNVFSLGNAYPSGATLDKLVSGSATWLIDSVDLDPGTYCLEAHLKVTAASGAATPTIALFDLSGVTPDTPLTGSAVSGAAGDTVGSVVRSSPISFPGPGVAKRYGVKVKTDLPGGEAIAWGICIIRLT